MTGFIRYPWRWYLLAALVVLLDQGSKQLALASLEYGESVALLPSLNLTLLYNPGAAFSFLSDAGGWQRWFFTVVGAGVSLFIVGWISRLSAGQGLLATSLALVLGGALGNLWDRMALGHVVDFIDVYYQSYHWPAFNVADSAITVGALLLILESLFSGAGSKKEDVNHE